jgi:hypothetical protein
MSCWQFFKQRIINLDSILHVMLEGIENIIDFLTGSRLSDISSR